jgi:hypothetical protein
MVDEIRPCFVNDIAVMVVSCDNYSDLWNPFFALFSRFWPDCPFKVYLLCNEKDFEFPSVNVIKLGQDKSWSDNVKLGISKIKEKYILLFIEDLFLVRSVDTGSLLRVCGKFIEVKGNYLRLVPTIKADKKHNEFFGVVSPGTIYRTSTILSLWEKKVFYDLLSPHESAWDFETLGALRSDNYDSFYASWKDYFTILNGVIKGKWERGAYNKIKILYPGISLNKRMIMSIPEDIIYNLKIIRSHFLNLFPSQSRRRIKRLFSSGKYAISK